MKKKPVSPEFCKQLREESLAVTAFIDTTCTSCTTSIFTKEHEYLACLSELVKYAGEIAGNGDGAAENSGPPARITLAFSPSRLSGLRKKVEEARNACMNGEEAGFLVRNNNNTATGIENSRMVINMVHENAGTLFARLQDLLPGNTGTEPDVREPHTGQDNASGPPDDAVPGQFPSASGNP